MNKHEHRSLAESASLELALTEWREALGEDHVLTDGESLAATATTTFPTNHRIPAILRPADREQVQASLRIANRHRVPVYPISRGRNWGYGSRVPMSDGCVLLDLGRMDAIVDFSEELAYVTVEPGVTQQQVYDFLKIRNSRLMLTVTGAPPDASMIGNALERGLGKGVYGDRFSHVCGLEVVLADGCLLHTGYDRFAGAKVAPLGRWGLGPSLDGLFSQSGLGVVTRMTLWLMPYPEYLQTFFYQLPDNAGLVQAVDALRELRLRGVLRGSFVIFNDLRLLSIKQGFPWQLADGKEPLTLTQRKTLRAKLGGGAWFGEGALFSPSRAVGVAERRLVKRALRGKVAKLMFVDAFKARWLKYAAALLKKLIGLDLGELMDMAFENNPQRGVPIAHSTRMAYWKKPVLPAIDEDPDRDRCGLIWCAPAVPFNGWDIVRTVELIESCLSGFGFDANIGLNFSSERLVEITVALVYDRDTLGADGRAMACNTALLATLREAGYLPYRLGLQSMDAIPDSRDDAQSVLETLRNALDPCGVLSPGRYPSGAARKIRDETAAGL